MYLHARTTLRELTCCNDLTLLDRISCRERRPERYAEGVTSHPQNSKDGMSIRSLAVLAMLVAGSLFITACQPQVSVSRSRVGLQQEMALEPPAEPLVPVRPSAIEGAKVFREAQCIICHGQRGFGDGPAAATLTAEQKTLLHDLLALFGIRLRPAQLPSRPANFHNAVAMRLNSPFSMYETVTRGRPHTAMPSFPAKGKKPAYGARFFGVNLTDAQRWHVIFHEFSYASTLQEVALGKQLYETKEIDINGRTYTCASCHGTKGDGRGPAGAELSRKLWGWARGEGPGIFTDINLMAQRKSTEVFQSIVDARGEMPGYRGKLTDDEIWALVNYIWTFVYDYPWPK